MVAEVGQITAQQDQAVIQAMLSLVEASKDGKTICPSVIAKQAAGQRWAWRPLMKHVRRNAVEMAKQGYVTIYHKGKPVHPDRFKGIYRIGQPTGGYRDRLTPSLFAEVQ